MGQFISQAYNWGRIAGWVLLGLTLFSLPRSSFASVVINEVLFNAASDDTGKEWVELYNNGQGPQDLSGWQLHLGDPGYITFPAQFSLGGGKYLVVRLRTSGNASNELYEAAISSNMSNSSGSLALFRPGTRSSNTIASFIRYQKPGASEQKTWESAAVEARLWDAGTFVDVSTLGEGSSIGLSHDGVAGGPASWKILSRPTPGSSNVLDLTLVSPIANSKNLDPSESQYAMSSQIEETSLGNKSSLYNPGHFDVTIIAVPSGVVGSPHTFRGQALGKEKKPIGTEARFLWNFGDGTLAEGPNVIHTYHFPGTYTVTLSVSQDDASGTGYAAVSMEGNSISIIKATPGDDGYIELLNASKNIVDLSGWILEEGSSRFAFPAETMIREHGSMTLPNTVSGLLRHEGADIILLYPNGQKAYFFEAKIDTIQNQEKRVSELAEGLLRAATTSSPTNSKGAGSVSSRKQITKSSAASQRIHSRSRVATGTPVVITKQENISTIEAPAKTWTAMQSVFFYAGLFVIGVGTPVLAAFFLRKRIL